LTRDVTVTFFRSLLCSSSSSSTGISVILTIGKRELEATDK